MQREDQTDEEKRDAAEEGQLGQKVRGLLRDVASDVVQACQIDDGIERGKKTDGGVSSSNKEIFFASLI